VNNEQALRILQKNFRKSIEKTDTFHSPFLTFHYILPPPPLLAHFNIGYFAKNTVKNPIKHFTKFSIVMFLILQGFIEIITKRLPQHNAAENTYRKLNHFQILSEIETEVKRNLFFYFEIF
jgi:hypothetical protein